MADSLSQEDGLSNLPDNWKYTQGYMLQAVMPCTDLDWLHSDYKACRDRK